MYSDYDASLRPSQSTPPSRNRTSDSSLLGQALATSDRLINSDIRTRIAAAALIYIADIILARWTGAREFGTYVYVWAFLLLLSDLLPLGFSSAAQHFIPEYIRDRMLQHMRGFIQSSRGYWKKHKGVPDACVACPFPSPPDRPRHAARDRSC